MSIWLRANLRAVRWDGFALRGVPPVLSPPVWALVERIWDSIGASRPAPVMEPPDWLDGALAGLSENAAGKRLCLVVPDATRAGAFSALIAPALHRLGSLPFAKRTLLIASGTHRPSPAGELWRHLLAGGEDAGGRGEKEHPQGDSTSAAGSEVPAPLSGWDLVQNSADEFRSHRQIGQTRAGTPVRLHPAYLDAEVRIVLGEVSYHYFAGFGGAPKLVFPGIGEPEGAAHNHHRAVREEGGEILWNEACRPGESGDNPVAIDLAEASALAPPTQVILAESMPPADPDPAHPQSFPIRVRWGSEAWAQARESLQERGRLVFTRAPEVLVFDSGGHPRDATFLQSHKSLQHAIRFVAPGSSVLWVASCHEGYGSRQLQALAQLGGGGLETPDRSGDEPITARQSSANPASGLVATQTFDLHRQTLCALRRATARARIALWSNLPPEEVRRLGIEPVTDEEEARNWFAQAPGRFWGWLPRAERFLPASGWRGGGLD